MKKICLRTLITLLWTSLIFGILYLPRWESFSFGKRSITVFTWGDILDTALVREFEKESGIKVHLNYYSSNEELLVKLKATKGEGIDLIIPSDYAVQHLAEEGLLSEIDKGRLPFYSQIDQHLLGHSFDPGNRYSLPFAWEIFGFGIDRAYFEKKPFEPSWKDVFEQKGYRISMINDPIEALLFASFYLFGQVDKLQSPQVRKVKELLHKQKDWVEAYASFRGDYFLATRNCPLVISSSSYIWRAMRLFDFIEFVIPKEGSFMTIENLCLPASSPKADLVYPFISFLFREESMAKHYATFGFFPSISRGDEKASRLLKSVNRDKLHFIRPIMPEQQMRDLWVEIKSGS
jgi:spermidine/putrescine transport system substrate-binding protein